MSEARQEVDADVIPSKKGARRVCSNSPVTLEFLVGRDEGHYLKQLRLLSEISQRAVSQRRELQMDR
jgi:hypothetical protein